MKNIKTFLTSYRISTLLFSIFTLLYWYFYFVSFEKPWSTFLLIFLYLLPILALYDRKFNYSGFNELVSYALLLNISAIIFLYIHDRKNQYISISNLLNTTNFFILISIWFNQLNLQYSFIGEIIAKGFIVGTFAMFLLFYNFKVVNYGSEFLEHVFPESKEVDGRVMHETAPNVREGQF